MSAGNSLGTVSWFDLMPRSGLAAAAAEPSFPAAVSPIAWVDTTQQAVLSDGAVMSSFQDNAVPARTYSGNSGIYKTGIRNGKPVIRMSGVGLTNYMLSSDITLLDPFLFWAALKPNAPQMLFYNSAPNNQLRFGYGGTYTIAIYNGSLIQSDAFTLAESTAWQYVIITRDASNVVRFFYNGASRSASPPTLAGSFTFNRFLGDGAGFQCDLGEAGFSALPAQPAIDQLSAYLINKWGF
jgi:hypothetical protein